MKTEEKESKHAIGKKAEMMLPLLLVFTVGGVFGFVYEELFYWIDLGYLVKRGTTFGPWIPIYGFGAVLILLSANRFRRNPAVVFAVSALACGALEYITGLALFLAGGIRLWDYNTEIWNWGNVGGFICARSVVFFGLSALLLLYAVVPVISCIQKRCKPQTFLCVSIAPAALFAADILLSLLFRLHGFV